MKKIILSIIITVSLIFSSSLSTFASESNYQDLLDLAHQITKVTPANSLKTKEEIDLLHKNDMEIEKRLKTLSPAQLNQLSTIIQ